MLVKTRGDGPLCIKCKQPTIFLCLEVIELKSGTEPVVVYQCDKCGMLAAESVGKAAA